MAGVQFRRQDNLQKAPRFRCSIVCELILRQATLSCPQHCPFQHPSSWTRRSLSGGLWCRRRATLRTTVVRALMPRSRALIPDSRVDATCVADVPRYEAV